MKAPNSRLEVLAADHAQSMIKRREQSGASGVRRDLRDILCEQYGRAADAFEFDMPPPGIVDVCRKFGMIVADFVIWSALAGMCARIPPAGGPRSRDVAVFISKTVEENPWSAKLWPG